MALATLKQQLAMGYDPVEERKPRKKRGGLNGMYVRSFTSQSHLARPCDPLPRFACCA